MLIATASGVLGEMQAALNSILKANPQAGTVSRLIRARIVSEVLVAALGYLLIVSLVVSAGLRHSATIWTPFCQWGSEKNRCQTKLCCIGSAAWSALWRN